MKLLETAVWLIEDILVNVKMIDKTAVNKDMDMDMDDARYRIKPYQQIASSCSGAIITSLTSKRNCSKMIITFFSYRRNDFVFTLASWPLYGSCGPTEL